MKKILLAATALLTLCATAFAKAPAKAAGTHRIMTCNVRITGLPEDEKDGVRWDDRKEACKDVILSYKPDIICMQEVIYTSENYFEKELKGYKAYGFYGPEMDPWTDGYHYIGKNVIFIKKSRYDVVASGQYWLSDDPLIGGSMSFGTTRSRHCTWMRLKDKKTGEVFRIIDAHLDHKVDEARGKQTDIIIRESSQYAEDFPQILCGDFNSGIKHAPVKNLRAAGWKEMWEAIHGETEYGFTYHGFQGPEHQTANPKRIDFIFAHGAVSCTASEMVKDCPKGIWPSDHYFLYADVSFAK